MTTNPREQAFGALLNAFDQLRQLAMAAATPPAIATQILKIINEGNQALNKNDSLSSTAFDLITKKCPALPFTAMDITKLYNAQFLAKIDWHDIGFALDNLRRAGTITLVGQDRDGMMVYENRRLK